MFDEAEAVEIADLLGEWAGLTFGSDEPEEQLLASIRWAGKTFRAADDVDSIVCLDEQGSRFRNDIAGTAHLERDGVETLRRREAPRSHAAAAVELEALSAGSNGRNLPLKKKGGDA